MRVAYQQDIFDSISKIMRLKPIANIVCSLVGIGSGNIMRIVRRGGLGNHPDCVPTVLFGYDKGGKFRGCVAD